MVDTDELHLELSEDDLVPRFDTVELRLEIEYVLLEFVFQNAEGQPCPIDRDVQLLQKIRDTADVVLVAVREHDAANLVRVADKIGKIRHDKVDPQHIVVGEAESAVDDEDAVAVFEHREVLADFIEAAERDDAELFELAPCSSCRF